MNREQIKELEGEHDVEISISGSEITIENEGLTDRTKSTIKDEHLEIVKRLLE